MSAFPSANDIVIAMMNQNCYKLTVLVGGNPIRKEKGQGINSYAGGYASVFPFNKIDGVKIAVRCWSQDIGDPKKRMTTIRSFLSTLSSSYFIDFVYHENALFIKDKLQPVLIMEWVDEPTLKEYLNSHKNESAILKVADNFKMMVHYFHQKNIAHGDLSHGNIKVRADGSLLVVDYDSMYVQGLDNMPDVIKGIPGYQHPARHKNNILNPKLDYFSELIIYLSLLVYAENPSMLDTYYGTEDLLFSKQDYESPDTSSLFQQLKKSSNQRIVKLTEKLINYCVNYNDITHLRPLEDLLDEEFDGIAISIISKF